MAAQTEAVLVRQVGRVLVATINRPEVLNAVNRDVATGLGHALDRAEHDDEIWAFIVTGAGDRAFCAGADLKAFSRGEPPEPDDPQDRAWGFAGYVRHPVSKPTIAAVNGLALGGGTEIVLASDLVIAANHASLGLPEVKHGVMASAGGAFRLPTQLPRKIAMEMIMTGEPLSAQRAADLGLVNRVVPGPDVLSAAQRLAEVICANAPLSVRASKRIACGISGGRIAAEEDSWALSDAESLMLRASADSREGPLAFAQKRAPRWSGR